VSFDAELRAYLEWVERIASAGPGGDQRRIDEADLRSYLLVLLTVLEPVISEAGVVAAFNTWSPQLARLAAYLSALSTTTGLAADAAGALARRVLDAAIGWPDPKLAVAERLEHQRIVSDFQTTDMSELATYALETSLVRDDPPGGPRLTPLGIAFLRLRGREAVRWLLIVELSQSTGRWDPWRASRVLFESALNESGIDSVYDDDVSPVFPVSVGSLLRLERMGVLEATSHHEDGEPYRYALLPEWHDVIRSVLGTGPWHAAIAAVLAEDRTGLVRSDQTPSEQALDQVKMIAHEVRNALIPARFQLDALRTGLAEPHTGRVDLAKRGIARVLAFIEEMLAANELITEVSTAVELLPLVHEALGWIDGGDRVELVASGAAIRVHAARPQLLRAVLNVLRNATQATDPPAVIRVEVHRSGGTACINVDDGGPGVPADARERVFQDGYTTRSEGSGFGLAYARRVVADQLRGKIWCEPSHLGGARFVIELPAIEPSA
jgi:signal transduction histidine kinase